MPTEEPQPTLASAPGAGPAAERRAAMAWAARAALVLALLATAMLGIERVVLAYPQRVGHLVEGFPVDRLVELGNVRGHIAYFGDSIVQTIALRDSDHRYLPDMVEAEIGEPVVRVSQAATGAQVHAAWLSYLASRRVRPRAVVIPVNPRSFSPHWERNPGWVFDDVSARIRHPLFGRLLSVLEWDFGRPTDEEFATTPVRVRGRVVGTIAELDQGLGRTDLAALTHDRYLVRYAADFAESRRIGALRSLIDEANEERFPVVFYLTPIDVEAARTHLSEDEMAAVEDNLALLREELSRSRTGLWDASTAVAHADFDHLEEDPHEHLRGGGRRIVADLVAEALETALGAAPPAEAEAAVEVITVGTEAEAGEGEGAGVGVGAGAGAGEGEGDEGEGAGEGTSLLRPRLHDDALLRPVVDRAP